MTTPLVVVLYLASVVVPAILATETSSLSRVLAAGMAVFSGHLIRSSLSVSMVYFPNPLTPDEWFLSVVPLLAVIVAMLASDCFRE